MRVFIYTSDKTSWALRPFAHLMQHYWSSDFPVAVFGEHRPDFDLPDNFAFNELGAIPLQEWSTGLIAALQSIEDEVILFMMDDYWLNRDVDHEAIELCRGYMRLEENIARFDMTTDRLYARGVTDYGALSYLDVIKSDPLSPYHFSTQAALWQRKCLIDCIAPHEQPWECEINGDKRLRDAGYLVLGTRQAPIRYTIAIQKGMFMPDGGYQTPTHALNVSDVEYIRAQGWIPDRYLS